ncbi:MAG: protein BatD [Candidatus Glassbacteria bacterium]|nr:protein BatD [Candidatus Glassbacteria bacterium]
MICICLASLLAPSATPAQDVKVELSLSLNRVSVNDRVQMTVTVSGTLRSVPEPQIQNLDGFTIVGSSRSSQFSFVNGRISASNTTVYTLLPSGEGTFTIGPATVEIQGKTFSSSRATVEVAPAAGQPPQAPQPGGTPAPGTAPAPQPQAAQPGGASSTPDGNIFIRGTVDKQEVYLGEQVIYTFGFYNRVNLMENPNYTPASFNGFWVEELDQSARRLQRNVGGRAYMVQELRYALFPTIGGEAAISPARLTISLSNVWDFFNRGRSYNLQTSELKIKVKPLPETGKPKIFSGAVGQFRISTRLDKKEVKQGEAITLEVVVSGSGNLKTVAEPVLPEMDDFDIYGSKSEEKIERSDAGIGGRKVFSYVIVPRKAGEIRWPGIPLAYFDPGAGKYVTVKGSEISFTVLPGKQEEEAPPYRFLANQVLSLGEDIRYIKESPAALRPEPAALFESRLFWLLHLVPLLCLGAVLLYRRHQGRMMSDLAYARLRGAGRRLARRLKKASRELSAGNVAGCYAELDRALVHFIGDKLNVETVGMVVEEVIELLARRELDEATRSDVAGCLEHFAYVRFTPRAGDREEAREYLKKVRKLTERLDRAL